MASNSDIVGFNISLHNLYTGEMKNFFPTSDEVLRYTTFISLPASTETRDRLLIWFKDTVKDLISIGGTKKDIQVKVNWKFYGMDELIECHAIKMGLCLIECCNTDKILGVV
jgi:hypothetical protein